ncbi:MAG: hypothetical protein NTZ44_02945 [Candidatus Nomurabacteria bacterium]|nr:hypothetical protein [Candidatus Nomurabacteria bacterium]
MNQEIEAKNTLLFRTVKSKVLEPAQRKFTFIKIEGMPHWNLIDSEGNTWYYQYDPKNPDIKFDLNYKGEFEIPEDSNEKEDSISKMNLFFQSCLTIFRVM